MTETAAGRGPTASGSPAARLDALNRFRFLSDALALGAWRSAQRRLAGGGSGRTPPQGSGPWEATSGPRPERGPSVSA